jgi:hypothetical protein
MCAEPTEVKIVESVKINNVSKRGGLFPLLLLKSRDNKASIALTKAKAPEKMNSAGHPE